MALGGNENPFGLDSEKEKEKETKPVGFNIADRTRRTTTVKNQAPTVEQEMVSVRIPRVRERKTKQLRLLTYPSLVEKMDKYAELYGLNRTEVFEMAVNEFLERNN